MKAEKPEWRIDDSHEKICVARDKPDSGKNVKSFSSKKGLLTPKKTISLTNHEGYMVVYVLERCIEYFGKDDRPDHGVGRLTDTRVIWFQDEELRNEWYNLLGKFHRFWRSF